MNQRASEVALLSATLFVMCAGVSVAWLVPEPPAELPAEPATAAEGRGVGIVGRASPGVQAEAGVEEPPAPGPGVVRCPLEAPIPVEGDVQFVHTLSESEGQITMVTTTAALGRGYVDFHPQSGPSENRGRLTVPGYLPVDVSWDTIGGTTTCAPIRLRTGAIIVGRVRPAEGRIYVRGCDGFDSIDTDGEFYLEGRPDEPCELHAERDDAAYQTKGPGVTITPSLDHETEVDLTLPELRTAGIGVYVSAGEGGLAVMGVRTASAAAGLGIRKGDLLVQFDGESLEGASPVDFKALDGAPEGTPFTVLVRSESGDELLSGSRIWVESSYHFVDRCEEGKGCGSFRETRPGAWLP